MGTPFKMKGSPMQRNFGIESPMKQEKTSTKGKIFAAKQALTQAFKQERLSPSNISKLYKEKKKEIREKNIDINE